MGENVPLYKNMDRFFIRLKSGESMTLEQALGKHLKATPVEVRQLLRQGSVWDNDKRERLRNGSMVIHGQLLRVDRPNFAIRVYELDPGDIKHEDDQLLVVYKRGGVPTQPTPYSDIDNLLHGVQTYYSRQGIRYRAAPVNRLDLPAQGLLIFAKSKPIEVALHQLFQQRRVRKRYLAATPVFEGVQPSYVIRSSLEWQGQRREALTYARFCRERGERFFFLVFPQSGRTHQIRRHFQEHVAPLLGDVRYGGAVAGAELWLLCCQYVFPHPGDGRRFSVRFLPAAWKSALGLPGH